MNVCAFGIVYKVGHFYVRYIGMLSSNLFFFVSVFMAVSIYLYFVSYYDV